LGCTLRKQGRPSVQPVCDRRSVLHAAKPADHGHMQEIMRIVDSDEQALAVRVEAALARLGGRRLVVSRFTLWYTTRPPVHHAVLRAEAPPEPLQ
jgi:hypothetical protein